MRLRPPSSNSAALPESYGAVSKLRTRATACPMDTPIGDDPYMAVHAGWRSRRFGPTV
ncbi:hypothetical protein ACWC9T_10370 [Kitasatospora sp. NPDC001159]